MSRETAALPLPDVWGGVGPSHVSRLTFHDSRSHIFNEVKEMASKQSDITSIDSPGPSISDEKKKALNLAIAQIEKHCGKELADFN